MHFTLLYGSVRETRQGIRAARFVETQIKARGHETKLVDPMETPLPFLNKMYKEYKKGEAPAALPELAALFEKTDGFVIVTGEYNHSIPPALKNLLDHFQKEYFYRPSAIVSYSAGGFGGVRAAVHLRAILCELGMPSIPSTLPVPAVQNSFAEDGTPEDKPAWDKRAKRFLDEFEWYARALKSERERGLPAG